MELIYDGMNIIRTLRYELSSVLTNLDILLLTSEKTASGSIYESLTSLGLNTTHLHSFEQLLLFNNTIQYYIKDFSNVIYYNNIANIKIPYVISIYRDPISRILSYYIWKNLFTHQELDYNLNIKLCDYVGSMPLCYENIFSNVFNYKFNDYIFYEENIEDEIIKDYSKPSYRVYVFRFDKLNHLEKIISDKIGEDFIIEKRNETREINPEEYDNFINNYRIPKSLFNTILWLEDDLFSFFYNKDEIENIKKIYSTKIYDDNINYTYPEFKNYREKRDWICKNKI
jgi:hypothetical protein